MGLIIFLILLIAFYFIFLYNSLIKLKIRVKEAWADIEVQLKRRCDLIPNLVEVVKGYMTHEKEVFEKVTESRSRILSAPSRKEKLEADNQLSQTLKSLFAVVENYPELKANQNFLELQKELINTEDKIQAARRFYNAVTRDYNIALNIFPKNIVAKVFGFKEEPLFEILTEGERQTPKVQF
jgi:LemA protein